jgi:hypothetical protein
MRIGLIALLTLGGLATPLAAQTPSDSALPPPGAGAATPGSTLAVSAGTHYRAGWLHRAFFGDHYRDLWAARVTVEVLDLRTYAGGLTPSRRGGGKQTKTLRLEAADGRKFAFRSVDKDPSPLLPVELRETLADRILQDQISAGHPAGALVVPPLLEAAGVPTAHPELFIMPDDPALGEFRAEFAGLLGTLEERPTEESDEAPGFKGARKVADTEKLLERLDRDPDERVDARAYLAARLMDMLVGDWDRHEDQWRWIKTGEGKRAPWLPVPYDRDQAFVRYDGLLLGVARISGFPQLVNFGPNYSSAFGLGWNARFLDRRLLAGVERAEWDSLARQLQTRLTDSVIDAAVRRLPREYYARDGARLAAALEHRRDHLPEAGRNLYRLLAREVDVHATDRPEVAVAQRPGDGTLELTLRSAEGGETFFRRRFDARETKEVRLHLQDGRDSVLIEGKGGGPKLRILAGGGEKVVADNAAGGWTRVYDSLPSVTTEGSHRPSLDRRPYRVPDSTMQVHPAPRDWGTGWRFNPWLGYTADVGFFIGWGPTLYHYGFRQDPFASRVRLRGGYATGANTYRVDFSGDFRQESSGTHFLVNARASGIEVLRFFGFGNETPRTEADDFYKVFQQQYTFTPAVAWSLGNRVTLSAGPVLKYATTDFDRPTLVAQVRPYGAGNFGQLGGQARLEVDTRDTPGATTRGVHLEVGGSAYPHVWDVQSTFGEVHGEASTYFTARIPLVPTLALRAGGKRVWGTYPFQEAAFIGGPTTVRGLRAQRFIGDGSAYGNAELRLRLARGTIVLPADIGVFGLADIGRVWLDGESSDRWHTAAGGGIWLAFLNRINTVSLAVARGDQRTAFYARAGFMF